MQDGAGQSEYQAVWQTAITSRLLGCVEVPAAAASGRQRRCAKRGSEIFSVLGPEALTLLQASSSSSSSASASSGLDKSMLYTVGIWDSFLTPPPPLLRPPRAAVPRNFCAMEGVRNGLFVSVKQQRLLCCNK